MQKVVFGQKGLYLGVNTFFFGASTVVFGGKYRDIWVTRVVFLKNIVVFSYSNSLVFM